jgi:hypothetical protein
MSTFAALGTGGGVLTGVISGELITSALPPLALLNDIILFLVIQEMFGAFVMA